MATAAAGTMFPLGITLHENTPGTKVATDSIVSGKKVVVFGVPGAFTPTCDRTHLPGYIADHAKFAARGIDLVCVSVNDAFVMAAWGKSCGADGKVRMLADTNAELAKALGVAFEAAVLGGTRSKRFSAYVDNGEIKAFNVEPDNTGATCSLSNPMLKFLGI